MAKLGKQFQLVVADVVQEMDPNATVREGKWIEGPDGLREIDVIVEGAVDGTVRRVQAETILTKDDPLVSVPLMRWSRSTAT